MAYPRLFALSALAWIVALFIEVAATLSVSSTVLILARDEWSAASAYSGLRGYGIPYQVVIVPSTGTTLPNLNSSMTTGDYGAIVVLSEVSYQYPTGFFSALTAAQWQQLYDYQTAFGVRMVRLDVYPGADFGTTTAIAGAGCCDAGVDQLISISNTTGFPTAGLNIGAGVSARGLWHYPATITDSSIAWEIAQFAPAGSFSSVTTAAVINKIGSRQQMVWFTSWATDWSASSNFLQHAWIHWATRGLYVGFRRVYLSTQVDDMFLESNIYSPSGTTFRIRPADLANHVIWMSSIKSRMPTGSNYFIEVAHNGNGNIEAAIRADTDNTCVPSAAIEYAEQIDTALEFHKPLGTGVDIWPRTPTTYRWSSACTKFDPLLQWWTTSSNLNAFGHISHTFTHEALNNATYSDTSKETAFNQAWLGQVGIAAATRFSSSGLIPPAITGLHNGDAIKAWLDKGIKNVVGDNTRPILMNTQSPFWPLMSTVASNGYAGLLIMPRWATTIYYNCDLPDCTLQEWINTSAGSGDFQNLLNDARATNTRYLLGLRHDPFMFHQANLRQSDVPQTTVNGVSAQLSLLQIWVEVIVQEMVRLTDWPIITLKHDDLATDFTDRMIRDQCQPTLTCTYSADGRSIVGATVGANGNTCAATIPVTFPGSVTSTNGGASEKVGSDPLTVWIKLNGSPVSFTLATPIAV